ncbi:glycoside hydrolase family 31 protein [Pontibacter sp. G13]|uniref:glycoside hydrolase family 31 protein n=1 Tax=Pontibacter sp. G13 TaxID=3074898 RepID=UPI002889A049|nr:glycoside hydrolase family 31 protein [Pontibacter sp. G13]WNJ20767.1 glycoside hydrolase family 31 protein [Pontibacter sp. G13]
MSQKSVAVKRQNAPGTLVRWTREENTCEFHTEDGVMLRVHVLTDDILRFRFSTQGYFDRDFSYAIDPAFQIETVDFSVEEHAEYVSIKTQTMECRLDRSDLRQTMLDLDGQVVLADEKGFHWEEREEKSDIIFMSKHAQDDEAYYGLGDKSCALNLRGNRLQNWATDSFCYVEDTDPLYRAIPFYYGLTAGVGYGLFFDNSFRTYFDFAAERDDATSFWAHGGEMNYYFINGPELLSVAERYTLLTGTPELPPLWAMGFHQCRWSYYPESLVKEVAHGFRSRKIPCDSIYLDIDYMDAYRCFTWNNEYFPDPVRMIRELEEDGFKTVVIIDPGIKKDPDYWVFKEGMDRDAFIRSSDGPYVEGLVWPGDCFFPDFTRPDVREWWSGLFRDLIRKIGVRGVWNDMNEPALFEVDSKTMVDDARHDYDGHPTSHRKAHNVYGMQMSRASYEGVKEHGYPRRPVLITRATYSGGQRFASVWTGDNIATWDHLKMASTQTQRLSVSGLSFAGSDIGGFNEVPDGELFVRWLQLGIFHPLCRVHSIGYNDAGDAAIDKEKEAANLTKANRDQEPWSFGEPFTAVARKAIELRYKLLPQLYTAFHQYANAGTPMLRPLAFLDQEDPETFNRMEEFCLGDHLLACPISEEGAKGRYLYLPQGEWYDFHTDQLIEGNQEIWKAVELDGIPMYARAGAVLPFGPVLQYVGEKKVEELDLHAYFKLGTESSQLYVDAGDGYDHEDGQYFHATFETEGLDNEWIIEQSIDGQLTPDHTTYRLKVHGSPFRITQCLVDGKQVPFDRSGKIVEVRVPSGFSKIRLS